MRIAELMRAMLVRPVPQTGKSVLVIRSAMNTSAARASNSATSRGSECNVTEPVVVESAECPTG